MAFAISSILRSRAAERRHLSVLSNPVPEEYEPAQQKSIYLLSSLRLCGHCRQSLSDQ